MRQLPVVINKNIRPDRTYSSGIVDLVPASNPTDILSILLNGYDSIVKVRRISISGIADTAATINVLIQSAPNSGGGTIVYPKIRPHDGMPVSGYVYTLSNAVIYVYSANDPSGNRNGVSSTRPIIRQGKLLIGTATTECKPLIFEFGNNGSKSPVVMDLVSWIVVNLQGQALPTNTKLSIDVEWEERRTARVSFVGDSTYFDAAEMYQTLTTGGILINDASIDNLGSNGYRLTDYINNTNGVTYAQAWLLGGRLKDIMLLGYGINDLRQGATTTQQLIDMIDSVITTTLASNPDCKIILHGPNMITADNYTNMNYVTLTGLFLGLTMAQAAQLLTNMLYDAYESFRNDSRIFALIQRQDVTGRTSLTVAESGLMKDQLHPNARGRVLIARALYPTLVSAVNAVMDNVYL